jgi:hypothetical protein
VLEVRPGLRASDGTLSLTLRSSRGGQHVITLPENAQLQSVTINGQTQPIRQEERKVSIPVVPGSQEVALTWRQARGISFSYTGPEVDLGAPSVNVETQFVVGADRWTLFTWGPRMGPAVLFWSFLLVLLIVATALSRVQLTPLRLHHWVLLGLGLTQVPVVAAALVVGWLLLLGWRKARRREGVLAFNAIQLLLVFATLVAMVTLFVSIREGLLGSPDMQIEGNGSSATLLRWFQDRCASVLPRPVLISVPILAYRLAMLAWALWLAFSLISWLRWAWGCFTETGAWRRAPPAPPKPPPAPPAPPAAAT